MASTFESEFLDLFHGKDQVSGHGEGYTLAYNWLKEQKNKRKTMFSCLIFYEKPIQFLAHGRTRNGKGDGEAVDKSILKYLPQLDASQIKDLEKEREHDKYGAFINVNFTMVRRIALMTVEMSWLVDPIVPQWTKGYGGIPTMYNLRAPKFIKMKKRETLDIKVGHLEEFKAEKPTWSLFTWEALEKTDKGKQ
jgi:hypothetical protein